MDIKDFILVGGSILIALVVGHGFWIAWRAKKEPLRLDIVPDLVPGHLDDMDRLRGELPNGGARVINQRSDPKQQDLALDAGAPTLMDPTERPGDYVGGHADTEIEPTVTIETTQPKYKPKVHQAPARHVQQPIFSGDATDSSEPNLSKGQGLRPKVHDVELVSESPPVKTSPKRKVQNQLARRKRADQVAANSDIEVQSDTPPVEELLVINVLAPKGQRFNGEDIITALRAQGLRYGDMNIFHRVVPATKAKIYSVANVLEPGTFDMSDLDNMRSPGMSFFLQLPGPEDAMDSFTDMVAAARAIAVELGGEVRDEQLSMLTGQATQHMRQRIADFARRRLSKRA